MGEQTSELNAKDGVFFSSFLVTLFVLAVFLWAPIVHYIGLWYGYWWDEPYPVVMSSSDDHGWDRMQAAYKDCERRAAAYFTVPAALVYVTASSTVGKFVEYSCYGSLLTKIPETH